MRRLTLCGRILWLVGWLMLNCLLVVRSRLLLRFRRVVLIGLMVVVMFLVWHLALKVILLRVLVMLIACVISLSR